MGALRDVIERVKRRQKDKSGGSYSVGSDPTREMMFASSFMLYQNTDELYVGKNSTSSENGFMELADVIELIIAEFFRGDSKEFLTPSAMFNTPIKKDLNKAIRSVLKEHNIIP